MSDEIAQTIAGILVKFLANNTAYTDAQEQITVHTDLISDLELESIQIMEYVVEIEDYYDISIDLESLSNARTVTDLAAIVSRELN